MLHAAGLTTEDKLFTFAVTSYSVVTSDKQQHNRPNLTLQTHVVGETVRWQVHSSHQTELVRYAYQNYCTATVYATQVRQQCDSRTPCE